MVILGNITTVANAEESKVTDDSNLCEVTQVSTVSEFTDMDNETSLTRGAINTIYVDRTFNVPLQSYKQCTGTAQVKISGYYDVETTPSGYKVSNYQLSVTIANIPTYWTFVIDNVIYNLGSQTVSVNIRYHSNVNNPYDCLAGGADFYTSITLTV